jgi:hypothetical protein
VAARCQAEKRRSYGGRLTAKEPGRHIASENGLELRIQDLAMVSCPESSMWYGLWREDLDGV